MFGARKLTSGVVALMSAAALTVAVAPPAGATATCGLPGPFAVAVANSANLAQGSAKVANLVKLVGPTGTTGFKVVLLTRGVVTTRYYSGSTASPVLNYPAAIVGVYSRCSNGAYSSRNAGKLVLGMASRLVNMSESIARVVINRDTLAPFESATLTAAGKMYVQCVQEKAFQAAWSAVSKAMIKAKNPYTVAVGGMSKFYQKLYNASFTSNCKMATERLTLAAAVATKLIPNPTAYAAVNLRASFWPGGALSLAACSLNTDLTYFTARGTLLSNGTGTLDKTTAGKGDAQDEFNCLARVAAAY